MSNLKLLRHCSWIVAQYQTFASYIYITSATTIKLSFLFLYRRLFVNPLRTKAKWFIDVGIVICLLFNLGVLFGVIFLCIPVEKGWDNSLPGRCSNPKILSYLTGVWNIIADFYVLMIPIPLIRKLNMDKDQKRRLTAVFGIGILYVLLRMQKYYRRWHILTPS